MLKITIPAVEMWDETNECFISTKEYTLQLEHSLVSLSKWESKWCKPFMTKDAKTDEELIDYVRCMTLTQNVPDEAYQMLTNENVQDILKYIDSPMTATTISDDKRSRPSRQIVTNELIYYWMTAYNIPFECQKWHLNRLMTLIRVCGVHQAPPKKQSKRDLMRRNTSMNAARKQRLGTRG
jgi:hypothetical protein